MNCFIRYVTSIPLNCDSDSVDPLVENAVQIVSLEAAQHPGDGFEKIVAVVGVKVVPSGRLSIT
jgi:hypothetical protein